MQICGQIITTSKLATFCGPDALPVTQPTMSALRGKYHIPETAHPWLTWGIPSLSLTTKGSCLSCSGGLPT